jgi:hypothetical protein
MALSNGNSLNGQSSHSCDGQSKEMWFFRLMAPIQPGAMRC